jgi:hypothetical protein
LDEAAIEESFKKQCDSILPELMKQKKEEDAQKKVRYVRAGHVLPSI